MLSTLEWIIFVSLGSALVAGGLLVAVAGFRAVGGWEAFDNP